MKTYTEEEFKKLYGEDGLSQVAQAKPQSSIGQDISSAFQGGLSKVKQGFEESKGGLSQRNPIEMTESGLKIGAGIVEAAFSPIAPATKFIGEDIQKRADIISDIPVVQRFAGSKAGETTSRIAEDVVNATTILGLGGAKPVASGIKTATRGAVDAGVSAGTSVSKNLAKAGGQLGGALKDIKPEAASVINHEVSKALHLTDSDMSNFYLKMDTDIGQFMADNNLLGENVEATLANVRKFKEGNYNAVRAEISNVPKVYKISQVPRYYDALKQIARQVDDVPGQEKVSVEVENLMKRDNVALEDVQRVKELLDEHFKLFKVTGDVKEASSKQGVANMRTEIKEFIEGQVKENTGTDIGPMNKNVMGSRAILDASELRTPRGIKSYQMGMGDWSVFGFGSFVGGGFNPVTGVAALFLKKALETPSVRLRIAKIVDGWSDARKAKAKAELEAGIIPSEFREEIKIKHNGQVLPPD